jgi:hypothetical protein
LGRQNHAVCVEGIGGLGDLKVPRQTHGSSFVLEALVLVPSLLDSHPIFFGDKFVGTSRRCGGAPLIELEGVQLNLDRISVCETFNGAKQLLSPNPTKRADDITPHIND